MYHALDDEELNQLALDGKTLCSTLAEHGRSIQLLSLFDNRTGCVLSQRQVPLDTNGAKGALKILKMLVLKGRVITGDAMFAQSEKTLGVLTAGTKRPFETKVGEAFEFEGELFVNADTDNSGDAASTDFFSTATVTGVELHAGFTLSSESGTVYGIPEPSGAVLCFAGLTGAIARRRRNARFVL